jgi:hypothetical protein
LRLGETVGEVARDRSEQIGQRRERELAIRLSRSSGQQPNVEIGSGIECSGEHGGLPDPGLALEHDRGGVRRVVVEERLEPCELLLSTDDHRASRLPGWRFIFGTTSTEVKPDLSRAFLQGDTTATWSSTSIRETR